MSKQVPVSPEAVLPFTGGTGALDDVHTVRNAAIFVGIASSTAGGAMTFLATATNVPSLRATNSVRLTVSASGVITVWINGTHALSDAAPVPATVLTGFTGSTGGLTDRHAVSNVVVSP